MAPLSEGRLKQLLLHPEDITPEEVRLLLAEISSLRKLTDGALKVLLAFDEMERRTSSEGTWKH